MNILKMLKSCRGAINKVALLATCGALGFTGLNLYNYATSTTAHKEARLQNLVSMARTGLWPDEYGKIQLAVGDTQFATAAEIAARERGIFDGGEETVGKVDNAFEKGQIFSSGADGLMMNNRASFINTGEGEVGTDGANATANAAAAAFNRGAEQDEDAALAGKKASSKGGKSLRSSQMSSGNGHNLGEGNSGGFGASGLSGLGEGLGQTGAASISGAMELGNALTQNALDSANASARAAKYRNGRRDVRANGGESMSMNGLREMTIASGKVAANQDRTANEGRTPFESVQDKLAGKLEGSVTNSFDGIGDSSYLDDANTKFTMPTMPKLEESLDAQVDKVEQEKQALESWLNSYIIGLGVAAICAIIAITFLAKMGPWGMVGAGILTAAIIVMVVILGIKLAKYVELCGGETNTRFWVYTGIGAAAVLGCAAAWLIGTLAKFQVTSAMSKLAGTLAVSSGDRMLNSIDSGVQSIQQDNRDSEK